MGCLFSILYGSFGAKELVSSLETKIKDEFDVLMVHSSYDNLLPMYSGTPQQVVDELVAYCGPNRTLVMPAFFLGGRLRDKRSYYRTNVFDVRKTPSEMGLLTEVFRRRPGVIRSFHPTHSVCALGPLAQELTSGHHLCGTRTGQGTPFDKMTQKRTVIAGLGVEWFRVLTQSHTAEDMLGDAFPLSFDKEEFTVTLIESGGNKLPYDLTVLSTSKTLDNTVLRSLLPKDHLMEWKFRGVPMFATYADKVTTALLEAAGRGVTVYGNYPRIQPTRSQIETSSVA